MLTLKLGKFPRLDRVPFLPRYASLFPDNPTRFLKKQIAILERAQLELKRLWVRAVAALLTIQIQPLVFIAKHLERRGATWLIPGDLADRIVERGPSPCHDRVPIRDSDQGGVNPICRFHKLDLLALSAGQPL